MKLAKSEKEKKSLVFFSISSFLYSILFIEQKWHIYTKKKEYFHCKKVRHTHTHTLFKQDNEALMNDQHEMMIDFYYTNQYLEKVMNCPEESKKKVFNFLFEQKFNLSNTSSCQW
jgi:hypothetical protein